MVQFSRQLTTVALSTAITKAVDSNPYRSGIIFDNQGTVAVRLVDPALSSRFIEIAAGGKLILKAIDMDDTTGSFLFVSASGTPTLAILEFISDVPVEDLLRRHFLGG